MSLIYLLLRMLLLGPFYGAIVTLAVLSTRREFRASHPAIVGSLHYGANYIHAKHLAVWYFVLTSDHLLEAKENGLEQDMQTSTRRFLAQYGYPKSVLPDVYVELESRENVDKGGGEWQYFH